MMLVLILKSIVLSNLSYYASCSIIKLTANATLAFNGTYLYPNGAYGGNFTIAMHENGHGP